MKKYKNKLGRAIRCVPQRFCLNGKRHTNGRTDGLSYGDARTHLKRKKQLDTDNEKERQIEKQLGSERGQKAKGRNCVGFDGLAPKPKKEENWKERISRSPFTYVNE